jgi:hypothetical protein
MSQSDFERIAKKSHEASLVSELWMFLVQQKKYWLTPVVVILLLFSLLVLLAGTGAAPFIYTLF